MAEVPQSVTLTFISVSVLFWQLLGSHWLINKEALLAFRAFSCCVAFSVCMVSKGYNPWEFLIQRRTIQILFAFNCITMNCNLQDTKDEEINDELLTEINHNLLVDTNI